MVGVYCVGAGIGRAGAQGADVGGQRVDLLRLKSSGLLGACGPICWAGMRPVPTWKSTAASPTPISDGPEPCTPWPCIPWQEEQEDWKSFLPSVSFSALAVEAEAVAVAWVEPTAAYTEPRRPSARKRTTKAASGWRRRVESEFTTDSLPIPLVRVIS